jgi:hypothetical protein
MSEERVSGGQNRVLIRGEVVYRPSHPWSEGTRRLPDFCRAEGLEFVPEWRGRDEDGNENEGCKQNLRDKHHELYLRDVRSLTTLHEKL